jgi:hypothetical protein
LHRRHFEFRRDPTSNVVNASPLRLSTLILAAAIALEVTGVRALPQAEAGASVVAESEAPAAEAPILRRAGSVEIHIVAQADVPAR